MAYIKASAWSMFFKPILSSLIFAFFIVNCTLNFVKDDVLKQLDKKYEGVYVSIVDIQTGNDDKIPAGTRIRLYFLSAPTSVKVYAYPLDISREKALGQNILYLFESDFPDNQFVEALLDKKLREIVKKVD